MRRGMKLRLPKRLRPAAATPGQAMIEMALVMLILLSLSFGIADFGLYMYKYVQVANCTREAARRAAVRQDPSNIPYCVDASLKPSISYSDGGKPGTDVTATVNTTHNWVAICYFVPGMSCTIALKSATTMRMEGQHL
jgi:Flp pilus assembly protein TadG